MTQRFDTMSRNACGSRELKKSSSLPVRVRLQVHVVGVRVQPHDLLCLEFR